MDTHNDISQKAMFVYNGVIRYRTGIYIQKVPPGL